MEKQDKQYVAQPLQIMVDIQLGPDGHPWIRIQFATPGMSTSIVIPSENGEDFIANITKGIHMQMKRSMKRQADTVVPDFTSIKGQFQ